MAMMVSQMSFSSISTSKSKNLQTACGMLGGAMQKQQLQSGLSGVGSKRSAASAGAAECFQDATRYREEVITKICALKDVKPVKIDFNIFLTETTHSVWKTVLEDKSLYMTVPPVLSNGSKESFITLLEFAEERLGCARCVLCIPKYRSDRAALLRTFMFMGFQLLGPGAPELACPEGADHQDYLYMVYVME